ncbi:hypothetical protein [Streptomyces sp. NPDC051921]|uniref:hypothetical protein n=1 Tax=Streptomyces sp. NPDC051921 TaxID=3155806 RepID=UPI003441B9EA
MVKAMRGRHKRLHKVASKMRGNGVSRKGPSRWIEVGGAIGGLAAGIGLIFTGIVTYYSVQTSQDQLDQKREDDDKEKAEQADAVDVHLDFDSDAARRWIVVDNYSRKTVREVLAEVSVTNEKDYVVRTPSVPPCTTLTIDFNDLATEQPDFKEKTGNYGLSKVYFRDASGQWWKMSYFGTKEISSDTWKKELAGKEYANRVVSLKHTKTRIAQC